MNSLRVHFPRVLLQRYRGSGPDFSCSPLLAARARRASAASRATSKGTRSFRIISVSHICILIEANVSPRYSRLTGLFSRDASARAPLPSRPYLAAKEREETNPRAPRCVHSFLNSRRRNLSSSFSRRDFPRRIFHECRQRAITDLTAIRRFAGEAITRRLPVIRL